MTISKDENRFQTLTVVKSSLITLYIALILPIPFLAFNDFRVISLIVFLIGLFLICNITNDYVRTTDNNISYVTSPISSLLGKKSWILLWKDIKTIKKLITSQGSNVYYFISKDNKKFLVPQRIEKFDNFIQLIHKQTGLETKEMKYLAPLWTYKILTLISLTMIIGEILTLLTRGYQD